MSNEKMTDLIRLISSRLANKYTFPNYDADDIAQEAYMIGVEALERWDGKRPLENFLTVHIKNRLYNFRRNNYYRPDSGKAEQIQKGKKKLLDASPFEDMSNMFEMMDTDTLESKELLEYIDRELSATFRTDYLRFLGGQKISKVKKINLFEQLKEIMVRYYEAG